MAEFRVVLQINALSRIITVDGKQQVISEAYWNNHINTFLYPFWTSDNDRLIQFNYFDNGSYGCERKKYVYDRVTTNKKWTTYEWKEPSEAQALDIANELKAKYFEYQDVEQEEVQEEMYQQYGKWNKISWDGIRMVRNFLLDDTDWTQMADNGLSADLKADWVKYRQKLRELPQDYNGQEAENAKFPHNPTYYSQWKDMELLLPGNETGTSTTANGEISIGATTITVTSATDLAVVENDYLQVETGGAKEYIFVSSISDNVLTVVRGQLQSLATAHANGVTIKRYANGTMQKPNESKGYLETDDQFMTFPSKSMNTWQRRITAEVANMYKLKNPNDVFPPADITSQYASQGEELDAILAAIEKNNV